jgi:hypothetical protein
MHNSDSDLVSHDYTAPPGAKTKAGHGFRMAATLIPVTAT